MRGAAAPHARQRHATAAPVVSRLLGHVSAPLPVPRPHDAPSLMTPVPHRRLSQTPWAAGPRPGRQDQAGEVRRLHPSGDGAAELPHLREVRDAVDLVEMPGWTRCGDPEVGQAFRLGLGVVPQIAQRRSVSSPAPPTRSPSSSSIPAVPALAQHAAQVVLLDDGTVDQRLGHRVGVVRRFRSPERRSGWIFSVVPVPTLTSSSRSRPVGQPAVRRQCGHQHQLERRIVERGDRAVAEQEGPGVELDLLGGENVLAAALARTSSHSGSSRLEPGPWL